MKDKADISKIKSKKKTKRINSRKKGNAFELKIAALLNHRFGTEEFCRSPGSGAFATTHNLPKHLKIYGDLLTPENFKFTIECKKGYNKENLCSFFKPNSEIKKFIKQAEKDAEFAGKLPMILIKQDRSITIVITKQVEYIQYSSNTLFYRDYLIAPLDEFLSDMDYAYFFSDI